MGDQTGVLLVNLGTPRSYQGRDVKRYLNEFLTDGRVITLPWLQRQLLVRGLIVPRRYKESAEQYKEVWTDEGSPLLVYGKQVKKALKDSLGEDFEVELAMRYQEPSIGAGLDKLRKKNCRQLIVLPLFPQYASATTGSVHQAVMDKVRTWTTVPDLQFISAYPDQEQMIAAFCARIREKNLEDYEHLVLSFHGLPESQIRTADCSGRCLTETCCNEYQSDNRFCYRAQCFATARAIVNNLGLESDAYSVCFQSRLGKDPWIQPYANDVIENLADKGLKRILVASPAFICDCLETIFEIGMEYNKEFQDRGGEQLDLVEGLNDHPLWIEALSSMIIQRSPALI